MERKTFKFKQAVYIATSDAFANFKLEKGIITGARVFHTTCDDVIYTITTPNRAIEALSSEIYASVEDFIKDVPNRVVE